MCGLLHCSLCGTSQAHAAKTHKSAPSPPQQHLPRGPHPPFPLTLATRQATHFKRVNFVDASTSAIFTTPISVIWLLLRLPTQSTHTSQYGAFGLFRTFCCWLQRGPQGTNLGDSSGGQSPACVINNFEKKICAKTCFGRVCLASTTKATMEQSAQIVIGTNPLSAL